MTDISLNPGTHIHLVGIGGAGISAIARVLLGRGLVVSGSDRQTNELTVALQTLGATVYEGHQAENMAGADALVISSAIPTNNPELVAAREAGIPILKRDVFLGQLMRGNVGIAVAGSHGKTTTTGMVAHVLVEAGLDPTVILGGVLPNWGSNGRFGKSNTFVVEADEYDRMFLGLQPTIGVVTNIEHDHPDIYPTEAEYMAAFAQFAANVRGVETGRLILCGDDPGARRLLADLQDTKLDIITYGIGSSKKEYNLNVQAVENRPNQLGGTDFLVERDGKTIGLARIRIPGLHNVCNALVAITIGLDLGIPFAQICRALASFGGVGRRFQLTGEVGRVTVIDDYAHHPTEIQATLAGAHQRYRGRRIWAVWQPHTYSRTKMLLAEFTTSFDEADRVIILDIYPSRETDTLGIDTKIIIDNMRHPNAIHIPKRREAADYLLDRVRPGDVILTLGAGDGNMVGQWVVEGLQGRIGIGD